MRVSLDITNILDGWSFDPDGVSVRIIQGDDGREKIQLRLDLGVLQMEVDGRPDGQRPEGRDSWLEVYRDQQRKHDVVHPDDRPFELDALACERLLREGVQFYHRYVSFWHLERYELCARDTNRNLGLFRFVCSYAKDERERLRFDQWRPYVTMMHARAVATPLVQLRDYETALKAIDAGIQGIERFLTEYGQSERADQCAELVQLRRWREEVAKQSDDDLPPTPLNLLTRLRRQLADAVESEDFELAARLRDEIRQLTDPPRPSDSGQMF